MPRRRFAPLPSSIYLTFPKQDPHKLSRVKGWLASEKHDGVRAFWNPVDKVLLSRQGLEIKVPQNWIDELSGFPYWLDGELTMGRQTFERVHGTVQSTRQDEKRWAGMKYMVFDMHTDRMDNRSFEERYNHLRALPFEAPIYVVLQYRVDDLKHLDSELMPGQEGWVLRDPRHPHRASKYKIAEMSTGQVIRPHESKRSVLVREDMTGREFYLTVKAHDDMPVHGAPVSFYFYGRTQNGIPKHAVME